MLVNTVQELITVESLTKARSQIILTLIVSGVSLAVIVLLLKVVGPEILDDLAEELS